MLSQLRRLPRPRHSHEHHVIRRSSHGRRPPPHRWQRNLPAAANLRASRGHRNHEAQPHHHPPEQSRPDARRRRRRRTIESILKFIRGTVADGVPIIPISAQLKFNIDAINEMPRHQDPRPSSQLPGRPAHDRHPLLRRQQARRGDRRAARRRGGRQYPNRHPQARRRNRNPARDRVERRAGPDHCRPIYSRVVSLVRRDTTTSSSPSPAASSAWARASTRRSAAPTGSSASCSA